MSSEWSEPLRESERVEVRNPGTLYDGLTIEEMRQGNVSRRRNPLIADLFRRIHMVEGWGRGMPLILENAPTVQFRQTAGLFIASFERPSYAEDVTQVAVDTTGIATGKATGKAVLLLEHLRQNPRLTTPELAGLLGMTGDGINYHLRNLQKSGLLKRTGGRKSGYWEVTASVNDPRKAGRAGV